VLISASCGSALREGPANDWSSFEAADGSFSVLYPSNFEPYEYGSDELKELIGESPGDASITIFANEDPGIGAGALSSLFGTQWAGTELRLGVVKIPSDGLMTARMFARLMRADYRRTVGYREITFEPITLANVDGISHVFETKGTMPSGAEATQTARYVYLNDEASLLIISAGALSDTYEAEEDVVDRFVSSFHLQR
jgi:hypothetical protein